jgi:hypothetical protein
MHTDPSRSIALWPAVVTAASLALAPLAQAAETAPTKPALLVPKAGAASAASAPTKPSAAPIKPRKTTRALGGDDDLKDLEVERAAARTKNDRKERTP